LDNLFKTEIQSEDFNDWFNVQFERNKISYENDIKGYGDWLKSQEENPLDEAENQPMNMYEMKEAFDKKKAKARSQALIVKNDICELYSPTQFASDLSGKVEDFNSDIFSSLKYQDLYEAHTNSVIPINDEDYESVTKFSNVNEYMTYRSSQDIKPVSQSKALQFINNKNIQDENKSMSRAFELAKQSELAQKKNNDFWSNILCLENKNL
jgi:site-specific recombinase XerD